MRNTVISHASLVGVRDVNTLLYDRAVLPEDMLFVCLVPREQEDDAVVRHEGQPTRSDAGTAEAEPRQFSSAHPVPCIRHPKRRTRDASGAR